MAILDLYLFGQPSVCIDTQPLKFHGPLPLTMFCYCVDAGRAIADDTLLEVFWPEGEGTASKLTGAVSEINTEFSRILKALGIANPPRTCVRNRGTLHFQWPPDELQYDVALFEHYVKTARAENPEVHLLEQAYTLYQRGPFLGTFALKDAPPACDDWVRNRRQELERQYHEILHPLSIHAMSRGDWASAIDYLSQLLQGTPEEEVVYGLLMLCHAVNGNITQAQATYEQYRHMLTTSPGSTPGEAMRKLQQAIQAGRLEPLQARELIDRIRLRQSSGRAPLQAALQEIFRATGAKSAPILSASYQRALQRAQVEAAGYGATLVGVPHLCLALWTLDAEVWHDVLQQMDADLEAVVQTLRVTLGDTQPHSSLPIIHTLPLQRILRVARGIAEQNQDDAVDLPHLWVAILQEERSVLGQVLAWHGVDRAAVLREMQRRME